MSKIAKSFSVIFFLSSLFYQCKPIAQQHILPLSYHNYVDSLQLKQCNTIKDNPIDLQHLDHYHPKVVKVNFHYMYDNDGRYNIPPRETLEASKSFLTFINQMLRDNLKMNLPEGNETPVLDTKITYKLTPDPQIIDDSGVYTHFDDELYPFIVGGKNDNRTNRTLLKKYGKQIDTVVNIFIMPHHIDSINSPTYRANTTGIALSNHVKCSTTNLATQNKWEFAKNISHELAHLLGLNHSWYRNDGCEDTPPHANCWNYTKNGSVCDSLVSSNLMDYNAYKTSLTPCQIGRMHFNLANPKHRSRHWLTDDHCLYDSNKSIIITDSVHWLTSKDIMGNILIKNNATLKLSCRVSMAENTHILIEPKGTLLLDEAILHNACGKKWKGIISQVNKKNKSRIIEEGISNIVDLEARP